MEIPMLDESEWAVIEPYLSDQMQAIIAYRKKLDASLQEAVQAVRETVCQKYEEITGFKETNYLAIFHHRISLYGEPCPKCGKLFRTPKANFCAACGFSDKIGKF